MKISGIDPDQIKHLAAKNRKQNEKLIKKLKTLPSKQVDQLINNKHQELFADINCLNCANCCKTTSPIILQEDIQRISKFLKITPSVFLEKYIIMDEDGDFVFYTTPCPFLLKDNKCSIYESRPTACQEYPHTQQRKQISILKISIENTAVCPAVYQIFKYLEETL